jgi:Glyoxalase-like domain
MTCALDHLLICVDRPRLGVDELVAAGFAEGSGQIHSGQGTACARFFFDNAFVEFLWSVDDDELASEAVRPTCLRQRMTWRTSGACPFGIALRGRVPAPPRWHYRAPFLAKQGSLPVWSRPHEAGDPLLFAAPGPGLDRAAAGEPLLHMGGDRFAISAVQVMCPDTSALPGEALDTSGMVKALGPVRFVPARRHALKIVVRSGGSPFHVSLDTLPVDVVGQ